MIVPGMRIRHFALLLLAGLAWPVEPLPHRWVYISRALRSDQDVEVIRQIARTAPENGLNGVLFAARLNSIDLNPPDYMARLEEMPAAGPAAFFPPRRGAPASKVTGVCLTPS